jgi:hypothetical protein
MIESKGHELTGKVGADTYAKVIQSSKPYREKGANADIIRRLRPKYSLPSNGYAIDNIDRVLSNIFASKASIANIRSALTSILVQDNAIDSRVLKLDENTSHISNWFDSREAWLDVESRRDTFQSLLETSLSHRECETKLAGLLAHCLFLHEQSKNGVSKCQDIQIENTTKSNEIIQQRSLFNEKSDSHKRELTSAIGDLTSKIEELRSIKDAFEKGYSDNGSNVKPISELISLHKNLSTLEQAEIDAEKFYKDTEKGSGDIVARYDQQRVIIKGLISSLKSDATSLEARQHQAYKQEYEAIRDSYDKSKDSLDNFWKARIEKADSIFNDATRQLDKIEAQLQNLSFLPSFTSSIAQYQKDLGEANAELIGALNDIGTHEQARNQIKSKQETLLLDRSKCNGKLTKLIDEQSSLQSRIKEGTLFDYLKLNVPDFEETIGKVISPALLSQKNLEPQYDGHSSTVYGLSLDLSAVAPGEFNSVDSITHRIGELDTQRAAEEQKLARIDDDLRSCSVELAEAESASQRAKLAQRTAQSFLDETNETLQQEEDKARADLETRQNTLEEQRVAIKKKIDEAIISKRNIESQRDKAKAERRKEFQDFKEKSDAAYQSALAKIEQDLAVQVTEQQHALSILDIQEAADVEAGGYSAETLKKARESYETAKNVHTSARLAGERVGRYNKFISERWPEYQRYVEEKQGNEAALELHIENAKEKDLEFANAFNELSDKAELNEQDLRKHQKVLGDAEQLISKLKAMSIISDEAAIGHFKSLDISELSLKYSQLKHRLDDLQLKGKGDFNIIQNAFRRKMGTPTYQFYERLENEKVSQYPSSMLWRECSAALIEYLDGDHLAQSDLLRSEYQLVAQSITEFSEKISSAHRELNALGRKLTASMKGIAEPFEAIGELEVSVTSNLKSLDYFGLLEDFRQFHEDWRIHHDTELPGDGLISKLQNLVEILGTKSLIIDVEKSFKFEVKLIEDGRSKTAKKDDEIENISSNGTSYIIILALYIGLINMIRKPESNVRLQFCIDELGRVDTSSSGKLIEILDKQNIKMFSALPVESEELLQHYPNCFMIEAISATKRKYSLYGQNSKTPISSKLAKELEGQ